MVSETMSLYYNSRGKIPLHGGNNHFSIDLFSVMENFVMLTGKKVTFDHVE